MTAAHILNLKEKDFFVNLKVAIIGKKGCGKTTIFNSLIGLKGTPSNIGIAKVPDKRLDYLYNLYQTKRKVPAFIEFMEANNYSLQNIDGILLIVKCFEEPIEPIKDANMLLQELLFSDLLIVEKRLSSIDSKKEEERQLIKRCKDSLSSGIFLRKLELSELEKKILSPYQFLTDKPIILVANVSEEKAKIDELKEYAKKEGLPLFILCGKFEMELMELEEYERESFRKEVGITEGIEDLIRLVYEELSLISFFTIGKNEVKAWSIPKGTNALNAAGKVHSDMQRGFIKASVIAYDDLVTCNTMAKEKRRLEGRDYIVKDGDIIEFKFNV